MTRPVSQQDRTAFEAWISAPPYERSVSRWDESGDTGWPGQYRDYPVQLAWEVWQALAQHPAIESDAPFAYFGKYANGEETIVRTLPTNPDYEDMLSSIVPLYRHPAPESDVPAGSRYPWKDAPEWATHATTSEPGVRCWWSCVPEPRETVWFAPDEVDGYQMELVDPPCEDIDTPDWRDSLESRPTPPTSDTRGMG